MSTKWKWWCYSFVNYNSYIIEYRHCSRWYFRLEFDNCEYVSYSYSISVFVASRLNFARYFCSMKTIINVSSAWNMQINANASYLRYIEYENMITATRTMYEPHLQRMCTTKKRSKWQKGRERERESEWSANKNSIRTPWSTSNEGNFVKILFHRK